MEIFATTYKIKLLNQSYLGTLYVHAYIEIYSMMAH